VRRGFNFAWTVFHRRRASSSSALIQRARQFAVYAYLYARGVGSEDSARLSVVGGTRGGSLDQPGCCCRADAPLRIITNERKTHLVPLPVSRVTFFSPPSRTKDVIAV